MVSSVWRTRLSLKRPNPVKYVWRILSLKLRRRLQIWQTLKFTDYRLGINIANEMLLHDVEYFFDRVIFSDGPHDGTTDTLTKVWEALEYRLVTNGIHTRNRFSKTETVWVVVWYLIHNC